MPISAKKPVVLVRPCAVFQFEFFAQGEYLHVLYIQNPCQVGVSVKKDAEEIEDQHDNQSAKTT